MNEDIQKNQWSEKSPNPEANAESNIDSLETIKSDHPELSLPAETNLVKIEMKEIARSRDNMPSHSRSKRSIPPRDLYLSFALYAFNINTDKVVSFKENSDHYRLITNSGDKYNVPKDLTTVDFPTAVPADVRKAIAKLLTDHI